MRSGKRSRTGRQNSAMEKTPDSGPCGEIPQGRSYTLFSLKKSRPRGGDGIGAERFSGPPASDCPYQPMTRAIWVMVTATWARVAVGAKVPSSPPLIRPIW